MDIAVDDSTINIVVVIIIIIIIIITHRGSVPTIWTICKSGKGHVHVPIPYGVGATVLSWKVWLEIAHCFVADLIIKGALSSTPQGSNLELAVVKFHDFFTWNISWNNWKMSWHIFFKSSVFIFHQKCPFLTYFRSRLVGRKNVERNFNNSTWKSKRRVTVTCEKTVTSIIAYV